MPGKSAHVKNEKQYEALKDKGMSKERAAKIANSPDASKHGGEKSHSGSGDPSQGGTHAQKVAAGRKGGKAHRGEARAKSRNEREFRARVPLARGRVRGVHCGSRRVRSASRSKPRRVTVRGASPRRPVGEVDESATGSAGFFCGQDRGVDFTL